MTIKEIEKIIDESVIVQEVTKDGKNKFWLIEETPEKISFIEFKEDILKKSKT